MSDLTIGHTSSHEMEVSEEAKGTILMVAVALIWATALILGAWAAFT